MGNKSEFIKQQCDQLGIPYDVGKGYATINGVPVNELDSIFDETTKGRMKISRTEVPTKSKHKHNYYPVLIVHIWDDHNHYSAGVKCSICGHVKWNEELFNKLTDTKFPFLGFDDEHFQEQYKGLEIVENESKF